MQTFKMFHVYTASDEIQTLKMFPSDESLMANNHYAVLGFALCCVHHSTLILCLIYLHKFIQIGGRALN